MFVVVVVLCMCLFVLLDYFVATPTASQKLVLEDIEVHTSDKEEEDPVPSAPPLSPPTPRIYPILPENSSDLLKSPQVETPTQTTPTVSPFPVSRSDFNMQRVRGGGGGDGLMSLLIMILLQSHTFFVKTIIKLETINCDVVGY